MGLPLIRCAAFAQRLVVRPPTGLLMLISLRTVSTHQSVSYSRSLSEVGKLELPKLQGKYETGQLFLHSIFGYRGVILFPWLAQVYDRDLPTSNAAAAAGSIGSTPATPTTKSTTTTTTSNDTSSSTPPPQQAVERDPRMGASRPTDEAYDEVADSGTAEVKGKTNTFYQVLIDSRDCPYIRAQTEAVTFLGNHESNRSLYAIPGLDYVAHEDVLPYSSGEKTPLHHELFDKFLQPVADREPPFEAHETLQAWQKKNHPWLELSDVHKETTEGVRVTVIPFYMGCRETPAAAVYWWRYCIRLENLGELSVQLRERHWRIFSLSGTLETVRGRGVVGQEPVLSSRLPAFQYSSHVSLQAPSGHMWGTFRLEREDGHTFDCRIPPFSLESKPDDSAPTGTTTTTTATTPSSSGVDGSSDSPV